MNTNHYIWELESDPNWVENKNHLAENDTLTLDIYCKVCDRHHALIVVAGRKAHGSSMDISIFKKDDLDKCPNLIEPKDRKPKDTKLMQV